MALVKSALFDRIKGSVDDVTFRERRNKKTELSKKGIPFDPESPTQLRSDAGYTRLAELYRTAEWPNWNRYDELSSLAKISRWNAWIVQHMPAMSRGPVSYWGFAEDEEAILHDFTENDNHGDIVGATWVPDGLYFDGINDLVNMGNGASLNITTGDLSIEYWMKSRLPATARLIGRTVGSTGGNDAGFHMYGLANGTTVLKVADGSNRVSHKTGLVNDGQWHHIVGTWVGALDTMIVYVDGAEDDAEIERTGAIGSLGNAGDFKIGAVGTSTLYFNGSMDEASLWNRALTANEIKKLYNSTKSRHI